MAYEEFASAEKAGWSQDARADAYVDLFAPVSDQPIAPLVEAGATVTGLDFSPAMLARARDDLAAGDGSWRVPLPATMVTASV